MSEPENEAAGRGRRVLVVDDDRDARNLIAYVLDDAGFSTIEAQSGDQALRTLAAETVDAVLLDVSMPGMDGLECLSLIRRMSDHAHTPVLMVSGRGEVDDAVNGLDAGADDYIVKPFSPDDLVARLRRHMQGRTDWAGVIREEVQRRRSLLAAATSTSTTTTLQQGAMEVGEGLHSIEGVQGVAIAELAGDTVALLASKGDDPLALLLAAHGRRGLGPHLQQRVGGGAWLEPIGEPSTAGVVSVAPIRVDEVVVGLIMTLPDAAASRTSIDRVHATTIDFGLLSAGIFGSDLLDTARRDDERRRLIGPIELGEFTTVFQPIVDLGTGVAIGHEALTRFNTGLDTAKTFAHAAQLGVTRLLETKTLEAAIENAAGLEGDGWLAVNVSPSVLLEEDLRPLLDLSGDRPIVLELSELEPVIDYGAIRDAVASLGRNVVLSVDDAGAGFASLAHVLALRASYVKIDRSWVHEIDEDPAKRALVAGIRNFASETDAQVIAEGIETEAELETVKALGIELGQGYLLGRPASR